MNVFNNVTQLTVYQNFNWNLKSFLKLAVFLGNLPVLFTSICNVITLILTIFFLGGGGGGALVCR